MTTTATDMYGNDLNETDSFGTPRDTCKHNRIASECVYCDPIGTGRSELPTPPSTSKRPVTIVQCPCAHEGCHYYGLSDGVFYQGNGWEKERAQQYADAVNSIDFLRERERVLVEALRFVENALFAHASAGANNVGKGKFVAVDKDLHPWIPGAEAWPIVEKVRAALALIDDSKANICPNCGAGPESTLRCVMCFPV